jgi:hypothetical protein
MSRIDGVSVQLAGNQLLLSPRDLAGFGPTYSGGEGFQASFVANYVGNRYSDMLRRRSALPITDMDERLIASAAMSGLNNQPVTGYSTPAASGIPNAL